MTTSLPLIRLSAANPFLLELRSRNLDAALLLREMDLPEKVPASDELFVSSQTMYQLIEKSCDIASDPHIGFIVGKKTELQDWPPIAHASNKALTVGDLLNHFLVDGLDHSSSTRFFLHTEGARTKFGFRRLIAPSVLPAQNDAFYCGLLINVLVKATKDAWDPAEVLFTVAEPAAIPDLPQKIRISQGDNSGVGVGFPSSWLLRRFEKSSFENREMESWDTRPPVSLVDSLRLALLPHIHEANLNADRAARICGYEQRRLSAKLRARGTTLGKEIAQLRAKHAQDKLIKSDRRVFEIARSVGFKDPAVFSRAFKNWTGQSPQDYRRAHR
jgi:AraC-like DNA-binding protein